MTNDECLKNDEILMTKGNTDFLHNRERRMSRVNSNIRASTFVIL